jgi:hypothetical protein
MNAWMYLESPGDQARFTADRGLLRGLSKDNDQIYNLYDSESYQCGGPDARVPTRPYLVTTDLFWEVFGAAFDGLFMVVERERAMPAFEKFVDLADESLRRQGPDAALSQAFAAARAVLEHQEATNPEARLILAAAGPAPSLVFGESLDFGQFRARGHYKTDAQKRYFAAMRYLSLIDLSAQDARTLRALDPAVGKAATDWIGAYTPFVAASRLDLVWGDGTGRSNIAAHPGKPGIRLFPLSWGWDNEALDNSIFHAAWPASEQIVDRGSVGRALPSGLDFAAVAGDRLADQLLAGFCHVPELGWADCRRSGAVSGGSAGGGAI